MSFSILLLLPLLIIGLFLLYKFNKSAGLISRSGNLTKVLASVYFSVLLIAIPVFYFLPNQGFAPLIPSDRSNLNPSLMIYNQQEYYQTSTQTFPLSDQPLSIQSSNEKSSFQVVIERKDVDDGEIEASTYTCRYSVENQDITSLLAPPELSFRQGQLVITPPPYQHFEFKLFEDDFTVAQFKAKENRPIISGSTSSIILIRVPKSLDVDMGNTDPGLYVVEET